MNFSNVGWATFVAHRIGAGGLQKSLTYLACCYLFFTYNVTKCAFLALFGTSQQLCFKLVEKISVVIFGKTKLVGWSEFANSNIQR